MTEDYLLSENGEKKKTRQSMPKTLVAALLNFVSKLNLMKSPPGPSVISNYSIYLPIPLGFYLLASTQNTESTTMDVFHIDLVDDWWN